MSKSDLEPDVASVLSASRALVGVAARSLNALPEDVTLPQFRALVLLSGVEPMAMGALAAALGLHPSTATRLVDRLVDRRLVRRVQAPSTPADRRHAHVALSSSGRAVVDRVTVRRAADLRRILAALPPGTRRAVADAMERFAAAAGEVADASWELGWERGEPNELPA